MTWRDAQPDLPQGWVWTTVGEVADADLGKMLDRKRQTGEHSMKYLRNVNVRWHSLELDDLLSMDIAPETRERYTVRTGDLLVCEGGEPGRCAVVSKSANGLAFQKALHRLRPAEGIDVHYLAFAFNAMSASGYLSEHFTGSTIKHLPRERLVNLPLPLPPSAEQGRIAAEVEAQMSRFRATVAGLEQLVGRVTVTPESRLGRLRSLVLRQAFTGRLVPQDPGEEPAENVVKAIQEAREERAAAERAARATSRALKSRRAPKTEETSA